MDAVRASRPTEPAGNVPELVTCSPQEVFRLLDARPEGLSRSEADSRLASVGGNVLEEARRPNLVRGFVANVTHLMAVLLWLGGLLALLAELPQLAVAVWTVNLINGVFSTWQEYRAEQAVLALRKLLPTTSRVLREGYEQQVSAEDLVPGDVLLLGEGDRISADARLVAAHELRVDQSALTGESRPVRRTAEALPARERPPSEQLNRVFAGTMVTNGRGTAVVSATGMATEFGSIATLTQTMDRELSPLQRELDTLSRSVAFIAVAVGLLFFVLAQVMTTMPLGRGLVFALGMIVAFVPEGLLPTVTLALAMATQRMARRHALVKRLSAVEALGSTTVICTDKTGTLTANQMTVRTVIQGFDRIEAPAGVVERLLDHALGVSSVVGVLFLPHPPLVVGPDGHRVTRNAAMGARVGVPDRGPLVRVHRHGVEVVLVCLVEGRATCPGGPTRAGPDDDDLARDPAWRALSSCSVAAGHLGGQGRTSMKSSGEPLDRPAAPRLRLRRSVSGAKTRASGPSRQMP